MTFLEDAGALQDTIQSVQRKALEGQSPTIMNIARMATEDMYRAFALLQFAEGARVQQAEEREAALAKASTGGKDA